ncbi:Excitatory amino acid transporter [Quillaja saponaria]|uniref:Excitatory amino acid transporter n=1 Tax=Quillaja saponaria TaxID=32244 RepID=A0AAD7M3Q0_QUISA|nr:Excitatory amino acid transporter [Quillaja saponaria]
MVLSSTMIGALLGLGTQMYSNALRKLPYMRHPWEHVLGMGLGVVFVNQLVKWDAQLQQDLDKMLEKAKAANERRYIGRRTLCIILLQLSFSPFSSKLYGITVL